MAKKKYASLSSLQIFLDNLKNTFASIVHTHTISDISDFSIDSALSSESTNPVQNKIIDAEFEAISVAMNALEDAIDKKSDASHAHDDKYYTESEIDTKLSSKSDTTHKHDNLYDTKGSAAAVQQNLNTVSDTLNGHTGNSNIHVTTDNKTNWDIAYTHSQAAHARVDATNVSDSTTNGNILINGAETNVYSHPNSGVTAGTYKSVTVNTQGHITAGSNPTTLSGYGITDAETKSNASAKLTEAKSYADSAAAKVKNDLLNGAGAAYDTLKELGDLISTNVNAIDALETVAAGKADKEHDHSISDITNLQATLDGKAEKSNFDTHVADTTKHITSTERTNWNAAYTHSQAAHAPSNAEKNQNAFSNIAVSGQTTVAADTATDTVTFVGSNVTITTDATNDKVTFTVANGSTGAKGVVQLTNSTSSTSTTTAATPSSVKSAYDLANTAKTNAATAQARADSAYDLAENIVYIGPTEPTDPNIKVWINTTEEGAGVVPVLPRVSTITLSASKWTGSANPYSQVVEINTVTTATKIDLQPTAQQIVALQNDDIALMAENNNGVVTIYALGGKPSTDYTMQVLLTEVSYV